MKKLTAYIALFLSGLLLFAGVFQYTKTHGVKQATLGVGTINAQPYTIVSPSPSITATTTRVFGTVSPQVDGTYDLGEYSNRWNNLIMSGAIYSSGTISMASLTASSSIHVSNPDSVQNMYVATTGTNSGTCMTAASPCLTIQYAIQQAANSIRSSDVNIYVGAGTYNGNLYALGMTSASTTNATSVIGIPKGPSRVNLIGDTTTPNNVVVQGDDTTLGVFEMENVPTTYSFDGFRFRAASSTGNSAFFVNGPKSTLILNNINSDAVGRFITTANASHVYLDNGTNGGTHNVMTSGVVVGRESGVYLNAPLTVTTFTTAQNGMITVADKGVLITGTSSKTWNFTSTNCTGGGGMIQTSGEDATFRGFGSSDTINAYCLIGGATLFRNINGGRTLLAAASTFNVSSTATYTLADIGAASYVYGLASPTYNMISGSARTARVYQGGNALEPTNFGGATITYANEDTDYVYGYDGRYLQTVNGTLQNVTTQGATTQNASTFYGGLTASTLSVTSTASVTDNLTASSTFVGFGTANAPTYSFTGDSDTGIHRAGANILALVAGAAELYWDQTAFRAATNNSKDLGSTTVGFRNIYASGTVISFTGLPSPGITSDIVCWKSDGTLAHQATNCTVSSERFKEHIQSLSSKELLEKVRRLRAVQYDYKPEQGGKHDEGFIAEEVAQIDPYMAIFEETTSTEAIAHVNEKFPGAVIEKDGKTYIPRSVAYDRISVLLTGALQAEDDRITALETKTSILDQTIKFIMSWIGL